ncbi:hydroxymethylglutaryl-CoA reductase, degradative [Fervidicoccus fontis]|jgi:hydroxymethylglutaryl-CoA reductase|uniref:3-hydroxy-3-methylglutaryl coenzyme A reductase n=1 Tax=Fervidicoccus fontis TaxID=683846 RepID=A0A2J6N724_9CREN|nr:hydroxymethylglutaryl-CoA reductase, degradative [Fervidicoccus fontis]PMB76008.1 MAG: hydroxymethylglutaryl-CoA reductase, degradative [Fervidicoccus fontis]PMB77132.1 MAG: hydroxymethylglutaryl-CoA reductase, degradative [Fervidicoccus fontis]HEW64322.1 hydroxymethylglutaryl-CoA reductase, degradative [Fervidicoccus fontis]
MGEKSSRIQDFHKMSFEEKLKIVKEFSNLSDEEVNLLKSMGSLDRKIAETMVENVVGVMPLPFSVAPNFRINGRDYLIPMVIEEASVVAAASNAARFMRDGNGIISIATDSIMIGQIYIYGVKNISFASQIIYENKDEILKLANETDKYLVNIGGGAKDVEVRAIDTRNYGKVLCVHLLVDVKDAMGANTVNTMAEKVAPFIEKLTEGRAILRILSNLADRRIVRTRAIVKKEMLGEEAVELIAMASEIAASDPYRAATHNKGIMNGVIAVALATGQDHRAIEAGAHSYAARTGRYTTLSFWEKDREGNLVGTLEMPLAVGIVGGSIKVHPITKIALKILNISTAKQLAEIMGAVGLAQNFAALRALTTEGIQKGHMRLHAKNIAVMAGASYEEAEKIAEIMVNEKNISFYRAKEILEDMRKKS